MQNNFDNCLALLLKSEGGYVNNPKDPGGRTNLGVTQKTWEAWVGRESSEKEMRALTKDQVAPLYKAKYWTACYGPQLPLGVDYAVFDAAVNMGVGRAVKLLQESLGILFSFFNSIFRLFISNDNFLTSSSFSVFVFFMLSN